MKPVFALQKLPKSIFLAGPTPREEQVSSWRPYALQLLEKIGFDGNVYVPESEDWAKHNHYDDQVQWEWEALSISTIVLFWIPRDLNDMPAFTSNVEFGLTVAGGKAILGYPKGAPKMNYLAALAQRHNVLVAHNLEEALHLAVWRAQKPYGVSPHLAGWE